MATKFLSWADGNNSNDGTTFANRVKDMLNGATAARTTAGDTWRMMKTEDPVSLGINATFTNLSDTVTLASSLTKTIDLGESAWTGVSANVTQSNPTTRKEGSKSIQFSIAAAFTTGQIGYLTFGGVTDFSAYNKVTFWIKPSASIISGALSITLCSDTIGAVAVNTITINEALTSGLWRCITVDTGAPLSAVINSISFNALSDPGTVTIQLDDILAANALTLTCLISLNSSATSLEMYPIASINGTTVKLDMGAQKDASTIARGFFGTTTTGTCYKIEPIRVNTLGQTVNKAGTNDATRVTFSGGWDATNMTSQTGLTFIDFGDSGSAGLSIGLADISFDHVVVVRAGTAYPINANEINFDNCCGIDCQNPFLVGASARSVATNCRAYNNSGIGFLTNNSGAFRFSIKNCTSNNNGTAGFSQSSGGDPLFISCTGNNNLSAGFNSMNSGRSYNLTALNNGSFGLASNANAAVYVFGITTSGSGTNGIASASPNGNIYLDNTACTDTTPFSATNESRIQISRLGGDPAVARIYDSSGSTICIQIDTSTVHGSSTKSYKHSPQAVHINSTFPLYQRLNEFAVASTGTLTFTIYVQRSSTNIGAQLLLRGGQSNGVSSDLTAVASAAINTWEPLTITCSPTQNVPIQLELQTWQINGGTGNAYFGDVTVTQI